ncbi:PilZ domain-containing protein [Biformimicrobium ophioploci]|uniref:Cyclic-di-GMP receptor FimW n=1 Tax=Biformimicrobium ophioploci TaxID=3036711 RepID=A0ABQ6LUP5_9GAMM|nr:PilZ domain-containing protein [Microbulbifer sp. NKW57]GMG85798.1 cyclic-di-GMP receptor FimW [Microbulbifer sp. NKW57]
MLSKQLGAVPVSALFDALQLPESGITKLTGNFRKVEDLAKGLESGSNDNCQHQINVLRGLLPELCRWHVSPKKRLPYTEYAREYIYRNAVTLVKQQTLNGATPLSQNPNICLSAVALFAPLAQVYASIARDLAKPSGMLIPNRRGKLAICLQRAIACYGQLILLNQQCFKAPPAQTWLRLNNLIALAYRLKVADWNVPDPQQVSPGVSPRESYIRTLLFAGSNPSQMRPEEMRVVYDCTAIWHPMVTLEPGDSECRLALLVSLEHDGAPLFADRLKYARLEPEAFAPPHGWTVNLEKVQELLAELHRGNARLSRDYPRELTPSLISRVYAAWNPKVHRRDPRRDSRETCEIVVGLGNCCEYLRHAATENPNWEQFLADLSPEAAVPETQTEEAGGDGNYDASTASFIATAPSASVRIRKKVPEVKTLQAECVDVSDNGVCFQLPAMQAHRLRNGELVCLRRDHGAWRVCVVRWIRAGEKHHRVGVQCLADEAIPVSTAIVLGRNHQSDYLDSLLVLGMGEHDNPPTLLLPVPLFKRGSVVDINWDEQGPRNYKRLRLLGQVAESNSIGQFLFEPL